MNRSKNYIATKNGHKKTLKAVTLAVLIIIFTTATLIFTNTKAAPILKDTVLRQKKAVCILQNGTLETLSKAPHELHTYLTYPTKRGDFASSYTSPKYGMLKWLARFDIVEIGGVGDSARPETITFLKKNGVSEVLCYDWMPAVYYYLSGENYPFTNWVYKNRNETTLNPDGPFPHTESMGYDFAREYYLDFGNPAVISKRVSFTENFLKKHFYTGVFWDWAPGIFIDEPEYSQIKSNFTRKHPSLNYKTVVGTFYDSLKRKLLPDGYIIFTNQGYRNAKNVLPYTNYDMAESYITGTSDTTQRIETENYGTIDVPYTMYFPVSEEGKETFNDTLYYLNYVENLVKRYGSKDFKKFVFMNYAAPEFVFDRSIGKYIAEPPRKAIYLSFATAKLVGETAYLGVPFDSRLEKDEVYFANLGKPLGKTFTKNEKENYAVRFYENGFVLVYFGQSIEQKIRLSSKFLPANKYCYDLFSGNLFKACNHSVEVTVRTEKDTYSGKTIPAGRVVMYCNIFNPPDASTKR